uniref:Pectinesterase n=1 Tax=Kalanchoe fedtschenkoi TaxID=63787 RepID=A0A7N1A8H3_KALFE
MIRAILLKWALLCLLCGCATKLRAAAPAVSTDYQTQVHANCYHTRFPGLCFHTLMDNPNQQAGSILSTLVDKVISETTQLPSNAKFSAEFGTSAAVHQHHYSIAAAHEYCDEAMDMSLRRLNQTAVALKRSPGRYKQDIQTWLSAVLTFQQGCKDAIVRLNPSHDNLIANQITDKMDHLIQLGSNALALINRLANGNTTTATEFDPAVEEEKAWFPSWVSAKDRKFLLAGNRVRGKNVNAIVAKDGSGNYRSVKEAIDAAPSGKQRYVIYVKAGVYKEKIWTDKDGITLIGDGKYSTVIVASNSVVKSGSSLYESATFTVKGEKFIAKDIGFRNDAGPTGQQAIALYISSDRAVLYRCSVVGYQDSLFAEAFRQFYRDCDISGTVDFIFGNAAAVFQNCNLLLRRPLNDNVILANGRNHPEQNTGFSLHRCKITSTQEFYPVRHSYRSFLGRPWKQYSRAVVMQTQIDDAIVKEGWKAWPGVDYSDTLYFGEYGNYGGGASTSKRVQWSGHHVMGSGDASKFTVENFIAGSSWISSTGVPFSAGLR